MEVGQAQNWAVAPKEKKTRTVVTDFIPYRPCTVQKYGSLSELAVREGKIPLERTQS
jgi:hypothetical protein